MDFELKLSDHEEHDGLMPNAYPPRKMFSTIKVEQGDPVNPNNRTGGMTIIRRLAEVIRKDGKIHPRVD